MVRLFYNYVLYLHVHFDCTFDLAVSSADTDEKMRRQSSVPAVNVSTSSLELSSWSKSDVKKWLQKNKLQHLEDWYNITY